MASQALRLTEGSGRATSLPSPTHTHSFVDDKIIFRPSDGGGGGNLAPPPSLGDFKPTPTTNIGQDTPTQAPKPTPAPAPPSPSPLTFRPPAQPVDGGPPSTPEQESPHPIPHSGSSATPEEGPHDSPDSTSNSDTNASSQQSQNKGSFPVTDIPVPPEFTGTLPLSAQETVVVVSICQGTDSCITAGGKTFSVLPNQAFSIPSSITPTSVLVESQPMSSITFDPLAAFSPSAFPQNMQREVQSPFGQEPLTIILLSTTLYFVLSMVSIAGAFSILRRRRRRSHISIRLNDGLQDIQTPRFIDGAHVDSFRVPDILRH
ncbi:hypothetical protein JR316_0012076 [Psilocybe cubensis]|uniref:Uncharacterized protein n=2 Tax=Psilocybe cubensis TaxID=181762 RepID=A0ACB8GHU2_PSICU|nr:hypothetical protein JR316_0012076 [Psilocybe cubensis]KAH9474977.1 hypothetical protein JR316_0012076 [Psilocybe cubensis]